MYALIRSIVARSRSARAGGLVCRVFRRGGAPIATLAVMLTVACSPNSLVDVQAPNTVADPSLIGTAAGAAQLRAAALIGIGAPLVGGGDANLVLTTGLLTDELTEGQSIYAGLVGFDERRLTDPTFNARGAANVYLNLHKVRARIQIALQALQLYATNVPGTPNAWQGEMYALEGYVVLWFAENFCSGIPLTDVKLVGPSTPTAGITTQDMLTRAVALFDSAMVAGADSARFVNLARVGKGRALLSLGRFAAADSAVRNVPTDFVYSATFTPSGDYPNQFGQYEAVNYTRVQDHEGQNGIVWSTDPRTGIVPDGSNPDFLRPSKYNITSGALDPFNGQGDAPVRIADGLEARLIEAEAALAAGDANWLVTLNLLRRTCVGTAACAPVPGITAENLPDTLTDRGSAAARQDLLFSERAMWLYLTAHREGDLRRLARVYGRDPETLWPTGTITSPAFPGITGSALPENGTIYGSDVVLGTDPNESVSNPLYGGCYDFNP